MMRELVAVFGRIGCLSFGGPAAQIALMHRELVVARGWLDESEFLRALSFCMLLPGPEAMQLATYAGWRRAGIAGGLVAGLLFVLPGAAVIMTLAAAYARWGHVPAVQSLFLGVKACIVVIVIEALIRVWRRALVTRTHAAIAGLSFLALSLLSLPFPLVIVLAALAGALASAPAPGAERRRPAPTPRRAMIGTLATGTTLWFLPPALLWLAGEAFLLKVSLFFAKLAVVTFGGAYAVLAYMAQTVVQDFGWVTTGQMIDALGLAETTPGPLILVTEFIAYLAGHGAGGPALALAAALLSLWMTFVPCFMWIFAFAPFVEALAARPRLTAALAGVTAAVVGVIASLALWFAAQVFFAGTLQATIGPLSLMLPDPATADPVAGGIAILAGYLLLVRHWQMPAVLALSAAAGAGVLSLA